MPSAPSEIISVADTTFTPFFFKRGLVPGAVIAVSCEPVQLPDNHYVKQPLAAVLDHALELWAVIGLCRIRTVDVMPQYRDAVFLSKGGTLAELPFDGFFSLTVRGIAGVDHGFHFASISDSICTSVAFNRSFIAEPGSKHISTNRAISGLFRPSFTQLL